MIFEIVGRCKNKDVVQSLVINVLRELKVDDHEALLEIRFVGMCDASSAAKEDTFGWSMADQEEAEIEIAKSFKGKKVSFLMQMRTLVHELIHIKQFLTLELCEQGIRWYGEDYDWADYDNQPWEIEAFGREDELFLKCYPWNMELKSGN